VIGFLSHASFLGYLAATVMAVVHLIRRGERSHRWSVGLAWAGWGLQTLALVVQLVLQGRLPLFSLHEALTLVIWGGVLLFLWAERHYDIPGLGAFVLPVVCLLALSGIGFPREIPRLVPALGGWWIWLHALLALLGTAALTLNFCAALMFLLQERQLKGRRPGAFYHRLPSLEVLDRLSTQTLTFGFPFLTLSIFLGTLRAGTAWGSYWSWDPTQVASVLAWLVYAATLSGRAVGGWRGRRAAVGAIVGYLTLILTLSVGLFLPIRHVAL
jgi:cytochrome c-type biogenesis protein CcsB